MADSPTEPTFPAITPVIKREARAVCLARADGESVASVRVERLTVDLEGIPGERHAGFTRPADVRVPWYKRGEPIHNERHLSIVSAEELALAAGRLGLERLEPEWMGANLMVSGLPDFSFMPRGTRLFFPSGAALAISDQNAPCRLAGKAISEALGDGADVELRFARAAMRLRGVVAYVDRPGELVAGDTIKVRVPEQWVWHG